jgi:Icc-related predicted phosphoesterase
VHFLACLRAGKPFFSEKGFLLFKQRFYNFMPVKSLSTLGEQVNWEVARIRFLAISDVHGKEDLVDKFLEWVQKENLAYDFIVAAGDIGNPQRAGSMCRILRKISLTLKKNVYYVKGNWDIEGTCGDKSVLDLDDTGPLIFGNIALIGHGRIAEPYEIPSTVRVSVLVTHYPPFSILDRGKVIDSNHRSLHAGVIDINYLIDYYKPRVHIFGHSHSFGGLDVEHNGVVYVNVARLDRLLKNGESIGNYAIIDVSDTGEVKVEWRFINGVWKKCTSCGRIVHIPDKWSLCRKCAHRTELKFARITGVPYVAKLIFRDLTSGLQVASPQVKIPFHTLKDYSTYEEFLDALVLREARNMLSSDNSRVVEVPKDKVLEFYNQVNNKRMTPFSEYLFACNDKVSGKQLCLVMRVFSADKRAHVLWKIKEDSETGKRTLEQYILFKNEPAQALNFLVSQLAESGFKVLTYSLEPVQHVQQ